MKLIAILTSLLLLTACSPDSMDISAKYPIKPDGLKDCQFYEMHSIEGQHIIAIRCPNSQTSVNYKSGKSTKTTVVIDGKEYVEKQ